jgi:hypothetical protein
VVGEVPSLADNGEDGYISIAHEREVEEDGDVLYDDNTFDDDGSISGAWCLNDIPVLYLSTCASNT